MEKLPRDYRKPIRAPDKKETDMLAPKKTIINNEFITVTCYPKKRILHHQFHQYVFGETFRDILMTEIEAFENHRCTKWLSDDRNFGALLPEDKKWGDGVWRPRALDAGWKHWAMVLPRKVTGQMNIRKMVEEYEALGVTTGVHSTPEEALKWLLRQP